MGAIIWVIRAVLAIVAQVNSVGSQYTISDCQGSCTILQDVNHDTPSFYGWIAPADVGILDDITGDTTATVTIVTVVNTVLNHTSKTTLFPPTHTYAPSQPTNVEGTAIQTISYIRSGKTMTETLTFPNFFFSWPDYAVLTGVLKTPKVTLNSTKCITSYSQTIHLTSTPQPTGSLDMAQVYKYLAVDPSTLSDSSGLSYLRLQVGLVDGEWFYNMFADWFPHDSAFTTCQPAGGGPHFGGFTDTYWTTTSTTSYVSNSLPRVTSSNALGATASPPSGAEQPPTRTYGSTHTDGPRYTDSPTHTDGSTHTDGTNSGINSPSSEEGGRGSVNPVLPSVGTIVTKSIIVVTTIGWTTMAGGDRGSSIVPIISTSITYSTFITAPENSTLAPAVESRSRLAGRVWSRAETLFISVIIAIIPFQVY